MRCTDIIKKDIEVNCSDPVIAGLEANAVIINRDDIDRDATVFATGKPNIIETLALKTGKRGYKAYVPGGKPFSGTKTSLEKGTYRNTFANDFGMVILDNNPSVTAEIIDGLANGKFVVVIENQYKNMNNEEGKGNSSFQIIGFYQGLQAETIDNDKYSEDTQGGWSILLKELKCPYAGLFLFKTSYTATKAMFDSLTAIPAA